MPGILTPHSLLSGLRAWWRHDTLTPVQPITPDLIAGNDAAWNTTGHAVAWRDRRIYWDNNANRWQAVRPVIQACPQFSIGWTVYGAGNTSGYLLHWDKDGGQPKQVLIRNSGGIQCFVRNSADTAEAGVTATSVPSSQWNRLLLTGDGTTLTVYLNGALSATASFAGPYFPVMGAGGNWYLHATRGSTEANELADVKVWDRCLSAIEAIDDYHLDADPDLAAGLVPVWIPSPSGGAVTGSVSEGAGAGESIAATLTGQASVSEDAGASESTSAVLTGQATDSDGAGAGDAATATLVTTATGTESAGAGDAVTGTVIPGGTVTGSTTEAAGASEASSSILTGQASVSEGAGAGDATTGTVIVAGVISGSVSEGAGASETTSAVLLGGAAVSEGAGAGESSSGLLTGLAAVTEGAGAGDAAVGSIVGAVVTGSPTLEWAPSEERLHWMDTDTRLHWG